MAKGYIIVDYPESCKDCQFSDTYDLPICVWCNITRKAYDGDGTDKLDWCPIEKMPAKAYHENYCDAGRYDKGWNGLRAEMFGEEA